MAFDVYILIDDAEPDDSCCDAPFSSTPWPLQRGQELRPVVSHCEDVSKKHGIPVCSIDLPSQYTDDGKHECIYAVDELLLLVRSHTSKRGTFHQRQC